MAESIIQRRRIYSSERLNQLTGEVAQCLEPVGVSDVTIFVAGSFGRLEGSEHSDIDLFFVQDDSLKLAGSRERSMRMFAEIIKVASRCEYPSFTNDCEHLVLHKMADIHKHLGGPQDDSLNLFTLRMLLLLESQPLWNTTLYRNLVQSCIDKYFRDFYDHADNFRPSFLINDIGRYWRTLLLNYEHKRNEPDPNKKVRQKTKNFKLKFSRRATCFATACYLGSLQEKTPEAVYEMTQLPPLTRLEKIKDAIPSAKAQVDNLLQAYSWFLEKTQLSTQLLEAEFDTDSAKADLFKTAQAFGDHFYDLIKVIDDHRPGFMKILVT